MSNVPITLAYANRPHVLHPFFRLPAHHTSLHVGRKAVHRNPHQPVSSALLHVHPPHPLAQQALPDLPGVRRRHALHAALPPGGEGLGRHRLQVQPRGHTCAKVVASTHKRLKFALRVPSKASSQAPTGTSTRAGAGCGKGPTPWDTTRWATGFPSSGTTPSGCPPSTPWGW